MKLKKKIQEDWKKEDIKDIQVIQDIRENQQI